MYTALLSKVWEKSENAVQRKMFPSMNKIRSILTCFNVISSGKNNVCKRENRAVQGTNQQSLTDYLIYVHVHCYYKCSGIRCCSMLFYRRRNRHVFVWVYANLAGYIQTKEPILGSKLRQKCTSFFICSHRHQGIEMAVMLSFCHVI